MEHEQRKRGQGKVGRDQERERGSSDEGEWGDRKNDPNHRMAGRAGIDRERGENKLVHMLKQTYQLTGFIPPFHSLGEGGGGSEGGRERGLIESMQLPRHV